MHRRPDALLQLGVKGDLTLDLAKLGLSVFTEGAEGDLTFTLNAAGLVQLGDQIKEKMQPAAEFFDAAGNAIEGTATEVMDKVEAAFCTSFPSACDVEFAAAASDFDSAQEYLDKPGLLTETLIDYSLGMGFYCFVTFDWTIPQCRASFHEQASEANEAFIAEHGGPDYIALHGVTGTGFGGVSDGLTEVDPGDHLRLARRWSRTPCAPGGVLEGDAVCDIPIGEPIDVSTVVAPVMHAALAELDPSLAELFASGQLDTGGGVGQGAPTARMAAASQGEFDPQAFVATIRQMADAFDATQPASVCAATISYRFNAPDGAAPPAPDVAIKADALGAKAKVEVSTTGGPPSADALQAALVREVLTTTVEDLACPTGSDTPTGSPLSFEMSATSIVEGGSLTLVGTASPNASVDVDWGDGAPVATTTAGADGAWTVTHTYLEGPANDVVTATSGTAVARSVIAVRNAAPTIAGIAASTSLDEGGSLTVDAVVADLGVLDAQTVTIDWGDGASDVVTLPAGGGALVRSHVYVDDDPTFTSRDEYVAVIRAVDDDGAAATSTSGSPSPTSPRRPSRWRRRPSMPARSAGMPADGSSCPRARRSTSPAPPSTPASPTARSSPSTSVTAREPADVPAERDALDPTLIRFSPPHLRGRSSRHWHTTDVFGLRMAVSDDDSGARRSSRPSSWPTWHRRRRRRRARRTCRAADSIAAVTFTAGDVVGYAPAGVGSETLAASTWWRVNGGGWSSGLPSGVTLTAAPCTTIGTAAGARQQCTWTVTGTAAVAPGTYTLELTATDDDTRATTSTVDIVVRPEDARVAFIGPASRPRPPTRRSSSSAPRSATSRSSRASCRPTSSRATSPAPRSPSSTARRAACCARPPSPRSSSGTRRREGPSARRPWRRRSRRIASVRSSGVGTPVTTPPTTSRRPSAGRATAASTATTG